jgi:hypothetical protein
MKVEEEGICKINTLCFGGFQTRRELQNNILNSWNIHVSKQHANLLQDRVTAVLIYVRVHFYCGVSEL